MAQVGQLERASATREAPHGAHLTVHTPGDLTSLRWVLNAPPPCDEDDVIICDVAYGAADALPSPEACSQTHCLRHTCTSLSMLQGMHGFGCDR